jgi:hypothetical protein
MTLSLDNPADGGNAAAPNGDGLLADPLVDPLLREVVMTYNSGTGKYTLVIVVPGTANMVGEWLVIQTDEGGSYRFQVTAP